MTIEEILKDAYFVDHEMTPPIPSVQIQGRTIATDGNFITINGLPKNYKSTVMQFFLFSAIAGQPIFNIELQKASADRSICIVDTEQGVYDFHRQQKRLKHLLRSNNLPNYLHSYLFRRYEPAVIMQAIEEIIKTKKPRYLFIDNLTELVMNANDVIESKAAIQLLKKWTAENDVTIICLLHLGRSNLNTLGHLGAFADRAAQTSIKVSVDKDTKIVTIEPTLMRSDAWFNNINIFYDQETGDWQDMGEVEQKPEKKQPFNLGGFTASEHYNRLNLIFNPIDTTLSYSDLTEGIKQMYGVGQNIARQQIVPYLTEFNYILSPKRGKYIFNKAHGVI